VICSCSHDRSAHRQGPCVKCDCRGFDDGVVENAADVAAQIDKLCKSLDKFDARELHAMVSRLRDRARDRLGSALLPMGLIGEVVGSSVMIILTPWIPCRPRYLVLEPETARSFDLIDYKLGNIAQSPDGGPVPLDTFSVEYAGKNDILPVLQRWDSNQRWDVAIRSCFLFERHADAPHVEKFRGLLWVHPELVW